MPPATAGPRGPFFDTTLPVRSSKVIGIRNGLSATRSRWPCLKSSRVSGSRSNAWNRNRRPFRECIPPSWLARARLGMSRACHAPSWRNAAGSFIGFCINKLRREEGMRSEARARCPSMAPMYRAPGDPADGTGARRTQSRPSAESNERAAFAEIHDYLSRNGGRWRAPNPAFRAGSPQPKFWGLEFRWVAKTAVVPARIVGIRENGSVVGDVQVHTGGGYVDGEFEARQPDSSQVTLQGRNLDGRSSCCGRPCACWARTAWSRLPRTWKAARGRHPTARSGAG